MREISILQANLSLECMSQDWVVLREDDPDFARMAAVWPERVHAVRDPACYTPGCTRYAFEEEEA